MRTFLLAAGIAIPFVYFANLFGVGAITPGFDQGALLPSELGRDGMANAMLFNAGLMATGACGVLAALGLFLALRQNSGGVILAGLTALCMLAFGVSMIVYGVFSLPDPRHYSPSLLIIASMLAPLFGAFALKPGGADRWILLAGFVAGLGMIALSAGLGGFATEQNVGWIVRAHGAIAFATFAYLCWAVLRRAR
ncbi:hypothetical protein U91I_04202 [alpha proteobacterium U9-1i]|nr:hypothetical protein U91I_04202 [alpha proteobacterium U9-1i]